MHALVPADLLYTSVHSCILTWLDLGSLHGAHLPLATGAPRRAHAEVRDAEGAGVLPLHDGVAGRVHHPHVPVLPRDAEAPELTLSQEGRRVGAHLDRTALL